jgi:hypothetical protein
MRLIRPIAFLFLFSSITLAVHAQDAGKNEMIQSIFTALQKKDKQAYIKLFPDLVAFKRLTREVFSKGSKDEEIPEHVKEIQQWTQAQYDSEFVASLEKGFKLKIENAEKKGVDWASAVFTKWTEDDANEEDKEGTVKIIGGMIYFTSKGKEFEMGFREIIWSETDKRWYGVDLRNVREKGANDDDNIGIINDGINAPAAVDSVYVAPVPANPVIDAPNKVPAKNKPKKQ